MRFLALLSVLLLGAVYSTTPHEWLGPDSVVLVCGAASYLGSEVSLALHRIYSPKRLILVDDLESSTGIDGMSRLEFQRQRLFRVLQEIATSENGKAVFYRVDLRPEVPEFIDSSTISVLDYIFKQHDDISHVVYLPEEKALNDKNLGIPKALPMHALLDQLVQWRNSTGTTQLPQFTYSSSSIVYSGSGARSTGVYRGKEDQPISEAPTSLEGSAYVLDELLAQTYRQNHHIDSVGLRLFSVYGPYNTPLSLTSQIADHTVAAISNPSGYLALSNEAFRSHQDYVYIDDAVDAIMIAMQLRPPAGPLVINVGSGESTGTQDLIKHVQSFVPEAQFKDQKGTSQRSADVDVVAHMDRAKRILGWEPTVEFEEGILKTLGWHFDRLHPRGMPPRLHSNGGNDSSHPWEKIVSAGRLACDRHDKECLRGTPVFPCASECAHISQCHLSFWDDAAIMSSQLSSECTEVWYTVALNPDLNALPSVKIHVSAQSRSNLTTCNFAFVSDTSPLLQRIKSKAGGNGRLEYDFWTLIPVTIDLINDVPITTMVLLPKLSPSSFFSKSVEIAVYTDPHIIFDDLPSLLAEARMQPYNPEVPGATGMLVGLGTHSQRRSFNNVEIHQTDAYRMIHMKAMEYLSPDRDGFENKIDSSFLVHRVGEQDVRSFRCDVFGEVWSWKVNSDDDAISFISGLHDMWNQILVSQNNGQKGAKNSEPWWHHDNVQTVSDALRQGRRRLEETNPVRSAPVQYHHMLQNRIAEEEEHFETVHHFDENGFAVQKKKQRPTHDLETMGSSTTNEATKKDDTDSHNDEATDSDLENQGNTHQKWLGMLSSGHPKFFIRLVHADDVGVVDLNLLSGQGPSLLL